MKMDSLLQFLTIRALVAFNKAVNAAIEEAERPRGDPIKFIDFGSERRHFVGFQQQPPSVDEIIHFFPEHAEAEFEIQHVNEVNKCRHKYIAEGYCM